MPHISQEELDHLRKCEQAIMLLKDLGVDLYDDTPKPLVKKKSKKELLEEKIDKSLDMTRRRRNNT